jgi:hypothetical protein
VKTATTLSQRLILKVRFSRRRLFLITVNFYRKQVLGILLLYELLNFITVNSMKILFSLLGKTLRIQKVKGRSEFIVL